MKRVNYIILSIMAASSLAACKGKTAEESVIVPAPLVKLTTAVTESVVDDQAFSSTVQPWAKNNIAPQTAGRIEKQLVDIGTFVVAGQEVARMDDLQLQQSELQVNNDKIEMERLSRLREQGGISQSDFDSFEMACKLHRATYDNLLKNTVLRSPVSGVISARNYDVGDMYSMAMPLFVVEQIVPVKLLVGISEAEYSRVSKGDVASVYVDAFPGKEFKGTITNIYPTIDANTHTFNVEVKVANSDRKLRPGMYAKVNVTFDKASRVIIPDGAVVKQTGSGERFAYVYNAADSTVTYKKIQVGRRYDNRYVVLDGIAEGDKVVVEGTLRLKDGVKVRVSEE